MPPPRPPFSESVSSSAKETVTHKGVVSFGGEMKPFEMRKVTLSELYLLQCTNHRGWAIQSSAQPMPGDKAIRCPASSQHPHTVE